MSVRTLLATIAAIIAVILGAVTVHTDTSAKPADCCTIPSGESPHPGPSSPLPATSTSAPTYGIPSGETFRPCRPTLGHPCP